VKLNWRKCVHETWCPFETAVLPDANASGILLIWSGSAEHVIYIGQGGIAKNLKWARQFAPILRHPNLFVTWATVPEDRQNGILNDLSERLHPVHRERLIPDAPLPVNLPWEET
jgi:hypothetical protein